MKLPRRPNTGLPWFASFADGIEAALTRLETLPEYTVASVPDATLNKRRLIYVSDESGGAVPAFSDGLVWRRTTDRAVIT